MPLYDFHCSACDKQFELLVRSADVPACPECGTSQIKRLISAIAPHGKIRGMKKTMRAAAAREGHLSNFSRSER